MVYKDTAEAYKRLMVEVAVRDYRATPGNRGAWCLSRADGDVTHIEMLTFWDDVEAIKRFAGEDYKMARYYDFDEEYLIEKEPHVLHFEVAGEPL